VPRLWGNKLFSIGELSGTEGRLVLPRKSQAVVKGHLGVSKSGLVLADALVNSKVGIWGDMEELIAINPELAPLRDDAAASLTMARASSTLDAYRSPVSEWEEFSGRYNCRTFPVNEAVFILFLQNRINYDKEKGNKVGGLLNRVYGIDLVCSMVGVEGPGTLSEVKLMMESARRQLGRPTVKKQACNKPLLIKLIQELVPDPSLVGQNLIDLRTAIFCLLGFVLEGRWAEVSKLCPSDITDYGSYMVAFIEVRKTSQHREGGFVPFMDSGEERGACALLRLYLSLIPSGNPDIPIFRRLDHGKVVGYIWRNSYIGYTRMSELVKAALKRVGVDSSLFGLHSFRSGAATEVGKDTSIDSRLHDRHGGWAAGSAAKDGYIEESAENLLRIPLHLSI
jgi:hypothetical protein